MNTIKQIKQLETMSIKELKAKYLEVFGSTKGVQNNKALIKCLAYKIQENALGGLDPETNNKINSFIAEVNPMQALKSKIKTDVNTKQRKMLLPGTIIRKNYKGTLRYLKM